jgi:hypothetical protein
MNQLSLEISKMDQSLASVQLAGHYCDLGTFSLAEITLSLNSGHHKEYEITEELIEKTLAAHRAHAEKTEALIETWLSK